MPALADHRAVVVGAAGTLGTATCVAYAELGATVLALDLDPDAAARTAAALPDGEHAGGATRPDGEHAAGATPPDGERAGGAAPPRGKHASGAIDVCDEASIAAAVELATADGPVDSVVYAAGITATADVGVQPTEMWRSILAVNLDGAFLCARAFTARMLASGRPGALTFLASTAGLRGEAGASAYCASKFGLIGLVRSLALEVAAAGLRANAVCPGDVRSEMLTAVAVAQGARTDRDPEALLRHYAELTPRGRLVEPAEVGQVIAWLATPAAAGLSGLSLPVDGGALAA